MVCSACGQNEATIHLTEILNNQMVEIHLCEACADQKGTDFKVHFDFNKLLASLADFGAELKAEEGHRMACRACGMTAEEFGRTGRLGCAECYQMFERLLLPLLKRVQRDVRHLGKVPQRASGAAKRSVTLRELYERLQKCIEAEAFEEAAGIRDEISRLEQRKKTSRKPKGSSEGL